MIVVYALRFAICQ